MKALSHLTAALPPRQYCADVTDSAEQLHTLARLFTPVAWTTPANLAGLRDALAATLVLGAPFTADFRYPSVDVATIEASAEAVRAASRTYDPLLRDRVLTEVDDIVTTARVIASRDDAALAAHEDKPARRPTPEVIAEGRRILAWTPEPPADPTRAVDAAATASAIHAALRRYGIDDWAVELHPNMSARLSVTGTRRLVKVRSDLTVTDAERDRLLAHEVGGHVLRWVNAGEQPEPLAALPLGATVATEEGNAASVEEELGVSGPDQLRSYALRVLAVDAGRTRGLVDLARNLTTWLSPADAAELALRVRRGFVDPDTPGVRSKDHGYLTGLLAFRRLRANAPDDLALLRVTKWPLEWLPLMRDLRDAGRLRLPRLTPDPQLLLGRE